MKRKLSSAILAGLLSAGIVAAPAAATAAPVSVPASPSVSNNSSIQNASAAEWLDECDYDDFADNQDPQQSSYLSVRWVQCMDIAKGYSNGEFGKTEDISRAEALAFLYRYLDPEYTPSNNKPFSDVQAGKWNHPVISWAKDNKIVKGYSDGSFGPNQSVTRGEFSTMLFRAGLNVGLELDHEELIRLGEKFKDVDPESAHYQAIQILAALGIARGYGDGSFDPRASINRGQVAELTFRGHQVMEKLELR